jgi:hypothetical protein
LLLLEGIIETPGLAPRLSEVLRPKPETKAPDVKTQKINAQKTGARKQGAHK